MIIEYPTNDDMVRLITEQAYKFSDLNLEDIMRFFSDYDSFSKMTLTFDAVTWTNSYNLRTGHVERSLAFMYYYFEKVIPEDIDFQQFDSVTFFRRDLFYYYVDITFYNLFSAWDILGHIINLVFHLRVKKTDFEKSLKELAKVKADAFEQLNAIAKNEVYVQAKQVRNGFTHNIPGGLPDNRPHQISPTTVAYGGSSFTLPSTIVAIAKESAPLLEETKRVLFQLIP